MGLPRARESRARTFFNRYVPTDAHVFMCGPLPFMRDARRTLIGKGVSPANIRYEVFGPDLWAQNPENAEATAA